MTERENLMMHYGELALSTLSSERQEALFEDYQDMYSRKVKLHTNLTDVRDK
jgi:hypothetical protein